MRALFLLAFLPMLPAAAQPLLPVRIGGTVTFDGRRLGGAEADAWQFTAARADGRPITPAIAPRGLTPTGGYAIDVPVLDAAVQPGGVAPGTALVVSVLRNGAPVAISQPVGGAVTIGAAGSLTNADLVLGSTGRLINLATRAQLAGGGTLIAGFVLSGSGQKSVLIRAVGPGLTPFGVAGALPTPALRLLDAGGRVLASNTGWGSSANSGAIATAAGSVGAFALAAGGSDSALLATLGAGPYTAQVTGATGVGGIALVEVYDVDAAPGGARLINLSTRAAVGTGGNILIPGFVTAGGARRLLIRAIGPGLAAFGVPGTLADPQLQVIQAGATVAANDNWGAGANAAELAATAVAVGAFALPAGSRDAVALVTLQPGPYTVQVSGVAGGTGEALVEIYEVP